MTLPLARTNAEAHIYMELNPCDSCGEGAFVPGSAVVEVDGALASRYAGPCPRCGVPREFTFRIPDDIIYPDADNPTFGDERPSELLDAGQWLWFADVLAQSVPAEPDPGMTPERRRQARRDLLMAAAALAEALKFIPTGTDDGVPAAALWSQLGSGVYAKQPGRFTRRRLEVVRRTYQDLAERFRDQPPGSDS